jgi:ATP-dependent helicase/DNAse subunit B
MPRFVSPTALEHYAACGYRYFAKRVLWLNVVSEPAEQDTMDALTRGSLIHDVLEQFFRKQQQRGRPAVREAWTDADAEELLELARRRFEDSRARGETGYDLYADHDLRTIQSDLAQFLIEDNAFRWETGAIPTGIEVDIPETQVAGVTMRGRVDRIDQTPDKTSAWVIDYKTGSSHDARKIKDDPLLGGTKLQLPWYITAVRDAARITALYWHITHRGNFDKIPYEPSPELDVRFERTVEAIIEGVAAGVFPAVPGDVDEYYGTFSNCKFCEFKRICSVRRDLAYEAKAQDPSMSAWIAVAEAAKADEA